ncbi:WecB/TagA/CpsF family glycosyltransferase [Candidatus Arthromitus sp. SFB-mouse-Japan]|uniref:WecB/TagA/CpsF family glycosyltransferase n=1 Tax=Candidatus Arthromitus sp. SFB-mouse TaxID=49118 RepID=UPI00021B7EF9|nr:WecB/TagA/CpsF family glycosyltransferase [Candidatus Arthromitus sp. SFB-mouse]EIA22515.1 Glycosyl transferase, WecB/TagA/CpsF family [Candidatus Arthromitus sp. SFB-2]EIA23762.1 Glycosyl transferase, WecB/TagA/CpsF family [Candidatus Arthromitus sp. SFB-1]EIA26018.1 Glycosyl transferase, WecB/TagA/CpsF family [Candidatus Arthromitus sp. SFB-4]EIA27366.1 Glycosyl transferase, WecB/TagA/CpsF family [Candidatus Arthromitus sp. SFB-co]EIA30960.1 Glycosyl transferase, WecB/TagA/CpsF family [Ca
MYTNLTGYKIYTGSKDDLVNIIREHLLSNKNDKLNIVSGNPEVLLNGLNDNSLKKYFCRDDSVVIPDGVGIKILLKLLKKINICKIAGIDIMDEVLKICNEQSLKIYFVGTTDENLLLAIDNILKKYPNINIVGHNNGYFGDNSHDVFQRIKQSNTDVVFVAMGSPRQDIFINKYIDMLGCKLFMGVGGSFDLYAGKLNRAPRVMINLGLEWLYRVLKEPVRIKRLTSIPKFMMRSFKYHLKDRC